MYSENYSILRLRINERLDIIGGTIFHTMATLFGVFRFGVHSQSNNHRSGDADEYIHDVYTRSEVLKPFAMLDRNDMIFAVISTASASLKPLHHFLRNKSTIQRTFLR